MVTKLTLNSILFALMLALSSVAHAAYDCLSADRQTRLQIGFGFPSVSASIESVSISRYYEIAYNDALGKLELVKELSGEPVLEKTADGYRGLLWAPTSQSKTVWSFVVNLDSTTALDSRLQVTDAAGKYFEFQVQCSEQPDYHL